MTSFREKVVSEVLARCKDMAWFRGVCLDGLEEYEQRNDLAGAIEHAYLETCYWDGLDEGIP